MMVKGFAFWSGGIFDFFNYCVFFVFTVESFEKFAGCKPDKRYETYTGNGYY